MCKKVIHLTEQGAQIHASALAAITGQMPNIYTCPDCGFIHVGYTASRRAAMGKRTKRNYCKRKADRRKAARG